MQRRVRHKRDVQRLIGRAFNTDRGRVRILAPGQVRWDCAGDCEQPFIVSLEGRDHHMGDDPNGKHCRPAYSWVDQLGYSAVSEGVPFGDDPSMSDFMRFRGPLFLDIETQCRKCAPCLRRRAARWAYRARYELALSYRTWFATFTADPETHFVFECRAASAMGSRGSLWSLATDDVQFKARCSEFGKELTKYFKRIRKNTEVPIRYILVAEAHKSGLPHFHALIHETSDKRVSWRDLSKEWTFGFSKFKLTDNDPKTARYVTKYLSKQALARVRASLHYGNPPLGKEPKVR